MSNFHIGDLLSFTTGRLTAPEKMSGVRRLANFVTGDDLNDIGLLNTSDIVEMHLVGQHPWLVEIKAPDFGEPGEVPIWLDEIAKRYGEWHEVAPLIR
jgi:hypothetical protein